MNAWSQHRDDRISQPENRDTSSHSLADTWDENKYFEMGTAFANLSVGWVGQSHGVGVLLSLSCCGMYKRPPLEAGASSSGTSGAHTHPPSSTSILSLKQAGRSASLRQKLPSTLYTLHGRLEAAGGGAHGLIWRKNWSLPIMG